MTATRVRTAAASSPSTRRSPLKDKILLRNSWQRVLRSSNPIYKNFSRTELEAFGSAPDVLLNLTQEQLYHENYEPQEAYKVHVPKSQFSTRTFSLISIPDWIVYTAITTLILEATYLTESNLYKACIFSNVPLHRAKGRPERFFRDWRRGYARFNKVSKSHVDNGYPYLAEIDLTSYFDLIDHDLLLRRIQDHFIDPYSLHLLERLLESWASGSGGYRFGHGIPQGPEASAFLGDLFLYGIDKVMLNKSTSCKYARYVDDLRVFCQTEREAHAEIATIEQHIKRLGLVPNVKKVRVVDARENHEWLKEESSEALIFESDFMATEKPLKVQQRLQHGIAKQIFLQNYSKASDDPNGTYLIRRSLPKLLPDKQVIEKLLGIYNDRADLLSLIFLYLKECRGNQDVISFCWDELCKLSIWDWESANLVETIERCDSNSQLVPQQRQLLEGYANSNLMPLTATAAARLLLTKAPPTRLRPFLRQLPSQSICYATWVPAALGKTGSRKTIHRSVKTLLKDSLTSNDDRIGLLSAYFFSSRQLTGLPNTIGSPYAARLLQFHDQSIKAISVDEIGPLLRSKFRVKIPAGFDFKRELSLIDPKWYQTALRHLRLAIRYIDTNPTYFVNHIHNFNHTLIHHALHKGNYVNGKMPWKKTMSQIGGFNQNFQRDYPTVCGVFKECAQARNTNISSHPYDDVRRRFSTWITYKKRDTLIAKLRAAYTEFIKTV